MIDNNTEYIQTNTVDTEVRQNQDNIRIRQKDIQNYLQKQKSIIYIGYIDKEKRDYNIRVLTMNTNRIRCKDHKKIHQFTEFCQKYKIDIALIIEISTK